MCMHVSFLNYVLAVHSAWQLLQFIEGRMRDLSSTDMPDATCKSLYSTVISGPGNPATLHSNYLSR